MSTHSAIIIKTGAKEYKGIYCHFDGSLSGVGLTLLTHYKTKTKILKLLQLGDLEALGADTTYDENVGTTAFYRDAQEEMRSARVAKTIKEIERLIGCEFNYLFRDGNWYYNGRKLTKKMIKGIKSD